MPPRKSLKNCWRVPSRRTSRATGIRPNHAVVNREGVVRRVAKADANGIAIMNTRNVTARRRVTESDDSAWYADDHHTAFARIR